MDFFSFYDSEWSRLEDTDKLFSQIDPIDGRLPIGENVEVVERSLPMYESARILCLTSHKWEEGLRVCYLTHQNRLLRLNGTSPPIHELNTLAPIKITEENVLYYLTFFCFFVRGEEGPFYVVYDLADKLLPEAFSEVHSTNHLGSPTPSQLFRGPRLFGQDNNGKWRASAMLHYSNAVFLADFLVSANGMLEMCEDQVLLSNLPCRINAPLTPSAGIV